MKRRAILYGRFSSNNQREESIDAQIRAMKEYCERNNIEIVGIYTDEAQTGKFDTRDDFQRMMHDVFKNHVLIDLILVHKFNRFARNKYDSAIYKKRLKDIGVKVVSVTQNIDDTPEGAMMESFLEAMDEYYSANLALEVQKGLRENALKGMHTGGTVPFGLTLDENKRYIPYENAEAIKRIFSEYVQGKPMHKIAEDLTADGYRNQRGKPIAERSLYEFLHNEKYIGNYIYTLKGAETIRLDGIIPPIISRELWDMAQKRNKKAKARVGKSERVYFLTEKAVCGYCGASVSGAGSKTRKSDGKKIYYYQCIGKFKLKNGCKASSIQKLHFEQAVIETVLETVMDDAAIWNISKLAHEKMLEQIAKPKISTQALKDELAELFEKEKRLAHMYMNSKIDAKILDAESHELSSRKHTIETELKARKQQEKHDIQSAEQIYKFLTDYISCMFAENVHDKEEFKRLLINTFVDSITLLNDEIVVEIKPNFAADNSVDSSRHAGAIRALAPLVYPLHIDRAKVRTAGMVTTL